MRFDFHMMVPTRLEGIGFMISRDPLSSSATSSTTRYGRDTPRLCRTVSHLEGTDSRTMRITPALFLVSILLASNRGKCTEQTVCLCIGAGGKEESVIGARVGR